MRWVTPSAVLAVTLAGTAWLHVQARAQVQHIRVVDGDTVVINAERIRLYGIDAPELTQTCPSAYEVGKSPWNAGFKAKWALQDLARGTIHIDRRGKDQYQRTLAVLTSDQVGDINAEMVARGMAWAYLFYTHRYDAEQRSAKALKLGVWEHDCVPAWEWRANLKR